ncbi:MAG TPA: hypothetical protein VM621_10615 [Luteibacter sp.]|uniref:hypothetical protein n=1 Tax=Luteibacter sp. TaxID=1886636 RepID=UPI002BCB941C|nr:hypothetical protein [Luteibacter sp.]HVI55488.1 hypothetical protein [Luteibacter sp.]
MTILDDIRQQYPQYADVPDGKLASAIRQKYYPDADPTEFYKKAGLYHLIDANAPDNGAPAANGLGTDLQNFGAAAGKTTLDTIRGAK